jgi:hypothetical protein
LLFFVEFNGAEGAVGLQGAEFLDSAVVGALGAGGIAVEAVQRFGGGFVEGGVDVARTI